jgi:LacI family transcriptional regulator
MGIGDFQGAAEMTPALSTIRIPAHTVGRLSANRMMELIEAETKQAPRHLKVDFEMRIRQSTAPYRGLEK